MKIIRTQFYIEQSQILMDFFSLLAGALLPFAFAPCNFYLLAFICPLIWLIALNDGSRKRSIWRGWLFGFGFFGVGVSWIYISIHTYGNTSVIVASILTLLFVAGLALIFALQAFCFTYFFARKHWLSLTIGFACCWTLSEVLRSWILTGFPWLLLGNSQLSTGLRGYAPIISVYGISFIVACISGLFLNAWQTRKRFIYSSISILLFFILGAILTHIQWTKPVHKPIHVSLIQGNIPQSVKWDPQNLSMSLNRYRQLAEQNFKNQLIIFPEGAIPDTLTNQLPFISKLSKAAQIHHSAIISGIFLKDHKTKQIFNAVIAFGSAHGVYLKQHLVPFGEYVPWQNLLRGLIGFFNLPMSNLSSGPPHQPLIQVGQTPIASFLCYEIAYLNLALATMPQAELLMTLSDDSWFGDSWAAAQQLQISQIRSVETGREQIVVGNSGFTAIINSQGKIIKQAPRNKVFVLPGKVQPRQGFTPLIYLGWPGEFILLLLVTFICWLSARRKNILQKI